MNEPGHLKALEEALAPFQGLVSWSKASEILERSIPPRTANGFYVYEDWVMPPPPEPGMIPVVTMHGSDGHSLFWIHPNRVWRTEPEKAEWYMDDDPLINPDTGSNYKACERAYRVLGFST